MWPYVLGILFLWIIVPFVLELKRKKWAVIKPKRKQETKRKKSFSTSNESNLTFSGFFADSSNDCDSGGSSSGDGGGGGD
ncbi:hypothetical protein CVD28_11055 [Bacillus sp. M6-12]|uniref:hypothetical protein n=1 Tax=Bacillus sp. M6-12 TaxID=2054166 RepID=UPI000C75700F|nr:hypothetical protein [Bacillus sp. M6-12]PLS17531.1 hypothetical protein CVD28_11055 [Bacillus sp. M6-12]